MATPSGAEGSARGDRRLVADGAGGRPIAVAIWRKIALLYNVAHGQ